MENILTIFQINIGMWGPLIALLLLGYFVWYFFYRPFDLFMDVFDLGFELASKHSGGNDHLRRHQINELRKRRKIGQLPPPYPNGWFAILESDLLPINGVKEVSALGQNLVAWRGQSGKCYVADAYCPHLGAHLGVGGKVVGKECIQCPFHSWSFKGSTGEIESIPYSQSKCLPGSTKLKMWRVKESCGFIHIWHHSEGTEPTWNLPEIPQVATGQWRYRGRSEFQVSCHIQEIPENGADVAHLNAVHSPPAFSFGMDLDKVWTLIKHAWSASWKVSAEPGRGHEAVCRVEHEISIFNDSFRLFPVTVDAVQIGPGLVHLHFNTMFGRGLMIQSVTPLEPLLQTITHRFYTTPTFIHPIAVAVLYFEAVQIARDIRIWNRKVFLRRPVLVKEDHSINKFRRWYSQFYSKPNKDDDQLISNDKFLEDDNKNEIKEGPNYN